MGHLTGQLTGHLTGQHQSMVPSIFYHLEFIHKDLKEGFQCDTQINCYPNFEKSLHVLYDLENLIFDQRLALCGMEVDLRLFDRGPACISVGAHAETERPPRLMPEFVTTLQSIKNEQHGFEESENRFFHLTVAYEDISFMQLEQFG